jgi:hypothetical protein
MIFAEQKITVKNMLRSTLNADAEGSSAVYEAGHREQQLAYLAGIPYNWVY